MRDKPSIPELIERHIELCGADGPTAELMHIVWKYYPDASKVEIHNAWADRLQANDNAGSAA